mmetsp:Transcript_32419/g.92357  ORF Transcript_32419/g.92357 Transcript_32419/m.92357 type:complete len:102 (-) Transcript_32419:134-439(-)
MRGIAGQQERLDLRFRIGSVVAAPGMGRVIGGFFGITLCKEQAHEIQWLVLMRSRVPAALHYKELSLSVRLSWDRVTVNFHLDVSSLQYFKFVLCVVREKG